jgi:hypothetical protein
MIKITVLSGKTFRGVWHFQDTNYDCSVELAKYAIENGIAKPTPINPPIDPLSDPNSYKGAKGPNDN